MIEFYLPVKAVHVAAVIASGVLFLVRGLAVQSGARWAMAAPLRYLSYTIDTTLLTAALMLLTMLHLNPFAVSWLGAKLFLLVIYIVLGSFALKRGSTRGMRLACFIAALCVYVAIISIARAHHPLGFLVHIL